MLALAGPAWAHSLEDATYEAMVKCGPVDQISLEHCGQVTGNSSAHSAARKAVGAMLKLRIEFVRDCERGGESLTSCQHHAEWFMLGGFNRAMDEETKAKLVKRD